MTQGLATIRAYGAGPRFRAAFLAELDANGAWWFAFISTARWVGFRLDLVAAATLLLASIFAMALHDRLSTRLVGLALSYTLSLSALLQWATRQTAEAENDMTSVERVLQFTHLPQEPPRVSDGAPAPPPCVPFLLSPPSAPALQWSFRTLSLPLLYVLPSLCSLRSAPLFALGEQAVQLLNVYLLPVGDATTCPIQ